MKNKMKSSEKMLSISGELKLDAVDNAKMAAKMDAISDVKMTAKMDAISDVKMTAKMDAISDVKLNAKMDTLGDVKMAAKMDTLGDLKMTAKLDTISDVKAMKLDSVSTLSTIEVAKPTKKSAKLAEASFISNDFVFDEIQPSVKKGSAKGKRSAKSVDVMGSFMPSLKMNFMNEIQPTFKYGALTGLASLSGANLWSAANTINMFSGLNFASGTFTKAASSVKMPSFQYATLQDSTPANPKVDAMGEPVIYNNLYVQNFPNMEIETFSIKSKVNEHAKLVFTAYIDDQEKDVLKNATVCTPIKVAYLSNRGTRIPFFSGVITNVKVYVEEGHQAVQVTALSNTSSMDTMKNSASCQNTGTSYEALIGKVCGRTGATVTYGLGGDAYSSSLGAISVQYRETDWDYIRRLASQKNQGLFVDMTKDKAVFSVGASGNERKSFSYISYEMSKDVRRYEIDHANYIPNLNDGDYVIYTAESYNILKIGDKVDLDGRELYVREASYEMKNAIVVGTYVLCPIRGLQQRRVMNTKIQGLSLNGKSVGVERDKVRVQLDIDSESNAEYLFPYSTMAASPDGSGWYCMPQDGDILRVYFPDDDEANAFAISSVSSYTPDGSSDGGSGSSGGGSDMMSDPSVVYLNTPGNMMLRMAPDGITVSANGGQSVLMMDTDGNLTISAANSISISASNDVNIMASKNMSIYATDSLKLSGQSGSIEMDSSGNTKVTGQYVLEN